MNLLWTAHGLTPMGSTIAISLSEKNDFHGPDFNSGNEMKNNDIRRIPLVQAAQ